MIKFLLLTNFKNYSEESKLIDSNNTNIYLQKYFASNKSKNYNKFLKIIYGIRSNIIDFEKDPIDIEQIRSSFNQLLIKSKIELNSESQDKLIILVHIGHGKKRLLDIIKLANLINKKNAFFHLYSFTNGGENFVSNLSKHETYNNQKLRRTILKSLEKIDCAEPIIERNTIRLRNILLSKNQDEPKIVIIKHKKFSIVDNVSPKYHKSGGTEVFLIEKMLKESKDEQMQLITFQTNEDFFEINNPKLDQRKFHFDSSIWYRYTDCSASSIDRLEKEREFYNLLGLYEEPAAIQYKAFNNRLFENSYVEMGDPQHSQYTTPFKFHSETLMSQKTDIILANISKILAGKTWGWKIAVVDDNSKAILKKKSKTEIIKSILNNDKLTSHTEVMDLISFDFIEYESNISLETIKSEGPFDIILMDYVFLDTNDDLESYGIERIKDMYFDNNLNTPFRKYWILPISAYNSAFIESMSCYGIGFHGGSTVISSGANPFCTPHLFRYKFFSFLLLQLNELFFSSEKNKKFFSEILIEIKSCNTKDEILKLTRTYFPEIVSHISFHKNLSQFYEVSLFAKSAIDNYYFGITDNRLLEKISLLSFNIITHNIADLMVFSDNDLDGFKKEVSLILMEIITKYAKL